MNPEFNKESKQKGYLLRKKAEGGEDVFKNERLQNFGAFGISVSEKKAQLLACLDVIGALS